MRLFLVLSGKGGVGKTSVALGTALAIRAVAKSAGYLSCDLENCCASALTGLTQKDILLEKNVKPTPWNGIEVFGLSLMLSPEEEDLPILMKEEREFAWIDQFLTIEWQAEYIIADMPPGSGPETRAFLPRKVDGAIIVTAPQLLSEQAVARTIRMCREEYGYPIVGLVQNDLNNIGGEAGERLAERYGVPLLARIPWRRDIAEAMEKKMPLPVEPFLSIARTLVGEQEWTREAIVSLFEAGMPVDQIEQITGRKKGTIYEHVRKEKKKREMAHVRA